jgi:hypothetical protein
MSNRKTRSGVRRKHQTANEKCAYASHLIGRMGLQVRRFPDNKDVFRPTAIADVSPSAIKGRGEMTKP